MHVSLWVLTAAALVVALPACAESQKPVPVKIEKKDGRWRLLRGGKPYFIKGVGGSERMELIKSYGGNSTRTWGADEGNTSLDRAQALGMTVTIGIWLGQAQHGFNYSDPDQVKRQYDESRQWVLKHRNHPALLLWCLGNEMEIGGDTPALWRAINDLAKMVKELDPNHPVMTIVAEVDPQKVRNIQTYAPEVDIIGVNAYGGMPTVAKRLKEMGWTKPFVATEFGPPGWWESPKAPWGAPIEPTSTAKAVKYKESYEGAVTKAKDISLGSYAFLWGHKMESTPTWFGMLLPTGETTEAVDVISRAWRGRWPENRAPRILAWDAEPQEVAPGGSVIASVRAEDPDGDPLTYQWEVRKDGEEAVLPDVATDQKAAQASVAAPKEPGDYRLYVTIRDGKGHGAVANIPFRVKAGDPT